MLLFLCPCLFLGLSPPAYAAFQTAAVIPAEAALYQPQALLPAARTPQASAAAPPTVTYYPAQAAQLYMNYTAYYPRYPLDLTASLAISSQWSKQLCICS